MSVWARLGAFVVVLLGTFGTAYAMAVIFIVVLLTLLLIQTRILERQVHYS